MKRVSCIVRNNRGREVARKDPAAYVTVGSYRYTYHKVAPVAVPSFVVSA